MTAKPAYFEKMHKDHSSPHTPPATAQYRDNYDATFRRKTEADKEFDKVARKLGYCRCGRIHLGGHPHVIEPVAGAHMKHTRHTCG